GPSLASTAAAASPAAVGGLPHGPAVAGARRGVAGDAGDALAVGLARLRRLGAGCRALVQDGVAGADGGGEVEAGRAAAAVGTDERYGVRALPEEPLVGRLEGAAGGRTAAEAAPGGEDGVAVKLDADAVVGEHRAGQAQGREARRVGRQRERRGVAE